MKHMGNGHNRLSENGKGPDASLRWDDARVFLAVARRGSLSGAATDLGVGLATITRRIERLEHALGVRLFSRHQNGYRLTDDGGALVARAEALEQAGHAFGAGIDGWSQVAGRVRVATAENLASALIVPSLPALFSRHPGLAIEIVTDIHTVNLHRRDADLAVRMVKPESGNVTIRRLGVLGYGLYGSAGYVEARAQASDAAGFDGDQFIGWVDTFGHLPAAQWIERVLRGRPCALATTSLQAQIAAAQAGIGLAALPHFLARPAGLHCLQRELGIDQAIWLAVHSDLTQSRRVRVVADHLTELLHVNRASLRGE
jgi:DNA-binding transcriptional LysR family regulator